jgi:hypothetical protein
MNRCERRDGGNKKAKGEEESYDRSNHGAHLSRPPGCEKKNRGPAS